MHYKLKLAIETVGALQAEIDKFHKQLNVKCAERKAFTSKERDTKSSPKLGNIESNFQEDMINDMFNDMSDMSEYGSDPS